MRLLTNCPKCGVKAINKSTFTLQGKKYIELKCRHVIIEEEGKEEDYSDYQSSDGRRLYPFQVESCHFLEKANFNGLVAHEMGLGKTVISLAVLKKHPELLPCMILTKAGLKYQWYSEIIRWTGLVPQIIEGNDAPLTSIFKIFIVSIDKLRSAEWLDTIQVKTVILDECQSIKNLQSKRAHHVMKLVKEGFREKIVDHNNSTERITMIARDLFKYHGISERFELKFSNLGSYKLGECSVRAAGEGIIKGVIRISKSHAEKDSEDNVIETILHEITHAITPGAGHRDIWFKTAKDIGCTEGAVSWCDGTIEKKEEFTEKVKVIALSGTPIKNRIDEYFPILNILKPEIFSSYQSFMCNWVGSYFDGRKTRSGRLVDPERFKERTKDFIIRYERNEVLPDLPKINRMFRYADLGADIEKLYKKEVERFSEFYDQKDGKVGGKNQGETLAFLTRMRHLTGRGKIDMTIDFVSEFLIETDRKIVIFTHHDDVHQSIKSKLTSICNDGGFNPPLSLVSSLTPEERNKTVLKFAENGNRIMIASTLAAGEGLNLQFCSDCILHERQWNPANEEQAEGRFSRIGAAFSSVDATYMIALGSIDEFFTKLVENKRRIVHEALDGRKANWDESEVLQDLSDMIREHGRKEWGF
jgi:SNF2 family DNA or RNA helicase